MDETSPVAVAARMLPPLTSLNRPFWTAGAHAELRILRCRSCRRWIHPPATPCPDCGGADLDAEPVSGQGTVFTYTVNWHPFNPTVPVPIVIAIVELPEQDGLRFTTNIVDCVRMTSGSAYRSRFASKGTATCGYRSSHPSAAPDRTRNRSHDPKFRRRSSSADDRGPLHRAIRGP